MLNIVFNSLVESSIYSKVLILTFVLFFIVEVFYYLYFYTSVYRRNKKVAKDALDYDTKPSVSVIICAKNEETNLENFLPLALEQDYDNYEVIVVNDGSCDNSEEILYNLRKKYPHLYFTSIPQNTRVISHKKLAITVGVKAAKNEILLFTDADCRPLSPHWITEMVKNFSPTTEFVLGYGAYYTNKSWLSTLISYDTMFIAMQYLGFTYRGLPYMGVGRNIAYRKSTFFDRKGFAGFLHIPSGDDDLLINSFGNKDNTVMESSIKSKTLSIPETTWGDWFHQKQRHYGTMGAYTKKSKTLITLEPLARGMMYLSLLLMIIIEPTAYAIIGIAAVLLAIKYILQITTINLTAKSLKERKFYISAIILDIALPLLTLLIMFSRNFLSKKSKYSW